MSFWSFIGEFAVINFLCNLFSINLRNYFRLPIAKYDSDREGLHENFLDELQYSVDDPAEHMTGYERSADCNGTTYMDDCDIDDLLDRIDLRQDRFDDIEGMRDLPDVLQNELENLYDEMNSDDDLIDW